MPLELLAFGKRGRMKDRLKNQALRAGALGGAKQTTAKSSVLYLNYTIPCQDMTGVKIQPEVLLKAARSQNGGAARLFFLAKQFNQSGSRTIEKSEFMRWLLSLGISRRVSELWLARALEIGLMTRRDQWLDLAGRARGYMILGCNKIYKQDALIELNKLISKGWQAWVWACYVERFNERPISQAALRGLTDIPERDQREYERRAGVKKVRNIAFDMSRKADQLAGTLEFEKKQNAFNYQGVLAWNMPNSRRVNGVSYANKGRNRKIQKAINCSCKKEARDNKVLTIYHHTAEGLKSALNKAKRLSIQGFDLPDWLYLQTKQERFWSAERI